jgi:hypothetical protein
MQVLDKKGNDQPLTWLYQEFGNVEIDNEDKSTMPAFDVAILQEVDDPSNKATANVTAPAVIGAQVLDSDGKPVAGISVVLWWPDAPPLPGSGYHNAGVIGRTDARGLTSFPVGKGAYYNPAKVKGPHSLWLHDSGTSPRVSGLGMIAGTNHRHLDVTFQQVPTTPLEDTTPEIIRQSIADLRHVVDRLYQVLHTLQPQPDHLVGPF